MAQEKMYNEDMLKTIGKFSIDEGLKKLVQPMRQEMIRLCRRHGGARIRKLFAGKKYERTETRQGYRNGSYARKLKTQIGQIELEVY